MENNEEHRIRLLERERYQIEQIRQLDDEELQVEEVGDDSSDSSDDVIARMQGTNGTMGEIMFDACLASLHSYLGVVEDTHHRTSLVDSGTILTLPLFYLEGVVLFPEATLPLRIILPNFVAALERTMGQVDSAYTIGVVRVYRDPLNGSLKSSAVGTTAEIRQYRRLEDGSVNVVTRGTQRFHVRRQWMDVDGIPQASVEIIKEDLPLRAPRDAFGSLPPLSNLRSQNFTHSPNTYGRSKMHRDADDNNDSEAESEESFVGELSFSEMRLHQSAMESYLGYDAIDESTSSDDERSICESGIRSRKSGTVEGSSQSKLQRRISGNSEGGGRTNMMLSPRKGGDWKKRGFVTRLNKFRVAPRAFWPYWVYQMYDSFSLAQKTADLWKQIVGAPNMDGFVRKPDILSFYIASKIPVSESTRQELLEINGISYRLRREIELLEGFDHVRCKNCETVLARRSDMLVMSTEGPLGAYVNPGGYVHEIMTFYKADGLALIGRPTKEFSWFPGYAWTIANCGTCESHMGWLFTATNKKLRPKLFYGIRSSQLADDMR